MKDKRILIVDDSEYTRKALKNILEKNGFIIIDEVENGLEAVERYKESIPDLVIMDINMDIMDGLEALKVIKEEYPQAVIIMCTSMSQDPCKIEAEEAGASDYIVKPFDEETIISAVRRGLGS